MCSSYFKDMYKHVTSLVPLLLMSKALTASIWPVILATKGPPEATRTPEKREAQLMSTTYTFLKTIPVHGWPLLSVYTISVLLKSYIVLNCKSCKKKRLSSTCIKYLWHALPWVVSRQSMLVVAAWWISCFNHFMPCVSSAESLPVSWPGNWSSPTDKASLDNLRQSRTRVASESGDFSNAKLKSSKTL